MTVPFTGIFLFYWLSRQDLKEKSTNIAMFIYLDLRSSDIVIKNSISGKGGEVGLYGEMILAGGLSQ